MDLFIYSFEISISHKSYFSVPVFFINYVTSLRDNCSRVVGL